jgi:ABC-type transport system involved in cytochrome bd biosynthesis fused ATPase/permease subunit
LFFVEVEMFTLKLIFVLLLCAPLVYLAVILFGKLCDGVLSRHKG